MSEPSEAALLALVQGLRKAVADPGAEWVDANIVRLLLDRYDNRDGAVDEAFAAAGRVAVRREVGFACWDGACPIKTIRYTDCSVWKCPGCGATLDDRPAGWGGAYKVDRLTGEALR